MPVENSFGVFGRIDRLRPVGLYNTQARNTLSTVREYDVTQKNMALWAQNETRWMPWLRSIVGLRGDTYRFDIDSSLAANSGKASDQMLSPKFSLILGPWQRTELYLNYGQGFHWNDARGTTIKLDPTDGVTSVDSVDPLVRTKGFEICVRSEPLKG